MILKNPAKSSEFANFFMKLTACFGELNRFEDNIIQIARVSGIDLTSLHIDHLAVRMNDNETARTWRTMLLEGSKLLKESEVNGRSIGLFKLNQPLIFCGQPVDVIELPFPKGKIYPEQGWEHIEAVFPRLNDETAEQWVARTLAHFKLETNPHIQLKISQPQVKGEQLPNPTIAITFTIKSLTSGNNCCLKLHPYDIKHVICSE
ncbi:VOC family protein [Glaesserella sp.]|uniref:VOC family protein n=1 Tax=Glaesserella sp. TaxID=2094731 RepID=UPI00359FF041